MPTTIACKAGFDRSTGRWRDYADATPKARAPLVVVVIAALTLAIAFAESGTRGDTDVRQTTFAVLLAP